MNDLNDSNGKNEKITNKLAKKAEIKDAPYHERKTAVTYTLSPSVKTGIEKLARTSGYPSSSSFVNELLKQIIENNR